MQCSKWVSLTIKQIYPKKEFSFTEAVVRWRDLRAEVENHQLLDVIWAEVNMRSKTTWSEADMFAHSHLEKLEAEWGKCNQGAAGAAATWQAKKWPQMGTELWRWSRTTSSATLPLFDLNWFAFPLWDTTGYTQHRRRMLRQVAQPADKCNNEE